MADTTETEIPAPQGWMNDVQKTLAYFVTVAFVLLIFLWVFFPPSMSPESMAQLNQMVTTLQTLLVGAFGFFLGNTAAKITQDIKQQKVVDKLTSTNPPNGGPVAPLSAPTIIVSWWSLLEASEKDGIDAASKTDPRVTEILTALQSGKAEAKDINDLVAKGLLTQERASKILA